MRIESLIT